jgi:hypothetical protein
MARIVAKAHIALPLQRIDDALHALARQAAFARDVGDRFGFAANGADHLPAGAAEAEVRPEPVAFRGQLRIDAERLFHELREGAGAAG